MEGANYRTVLQSILSERVLCMYFKEWLKEQKCDENLNFLVEVELFKMGYRNKHNASAIYKKYLAPDAPLLLNVDHEIIKEVKEGLKANLVDNIAIFNDCQDAI